MTRAQLTAVLLLVIAGAIALTVWLGAVMPFTGLSDTPEGYEGHGGEAVAVREDETGLEYAPFPTSSAPTGLSHHTVTATVGSLNSTGDAVTGTPVDVLSSTATVLSISVVVGLHTLNGLTDAMHAGHYTLMTRQCPTGWTSTLPSQPSSGSGAGALVVDGADYCVIHDGWDAVGHHLMVRVGRSGGWITVLPYEESPGSDAAGQEVDVEITVWEGAAL